MPRRPSRKTTNELWALCGNECANPECNTKVIKIDTAKQTITRIGEVAHILGNNKGSNRYDKKQSDEERHSFLNLLILCPRCHRENPDGIDIPKNEARFPPALLKQWRESHLNKIHTLYDRNWICYPNSATEFSNGVSTTYKYWIDRSGAAQLYSAEQLAIVTKLFPLTISFSQIHKILTIIGDTKGVPVDPSYQTMNDAIINVLYEELNSLETDAKNGWIGYLASTMQVAQDITLGELFLMMANNGLRDREKHVAYGKAQLAALAKDTNPAPVSTRVEPSTIKKG